MYTLLYSRRCICVYVDWCVWRVWVSFFCECELVCFSYIFFNIYSYGSSLYFCISPSDLFFSCISVDIYVYILILICIIFFFVYMIEKHFLSSMWPGFRVQFMQVEAGPSANFFYVVGLIKIIDWDFYAYMCLYYVYSVINNK